MQSGNLAARRVWNSPRGSIDGAWSVVTRQQVRAQEATTHLRRLMSSRGGSSARPAPVNDTSAV